MGRPDDVADQVWTYSYGEDGRLAALVVDFPGGQSWRFEYRYDDAGRLVREDLYDTWGDFPDESVWGCEWYPDGFPRP